jgi:hypothetical protein
MASRVAFAGATSTVAGSRRMPPDRRRMSSEKVAENIRFCRFAGSSAMIFWMSGRKPMSSIRSASSRTRISTCPRLATLCPTRSSRRPGVATRISMPPRNALIWGSIGIPP